MSTNRATRWGRTLLYLMTAIPLGVVGGAALIAGWIVVACLAITPLVVPALAAFRAVVGGLARTEAALADTLLGTAIGRPRASSPGPQGFWRRAGNVLGDGAFWKQQSLLMLRAVLGGALAIGEVAILAAGLGAIAEPVYYRWADTQITSSYHVDTLGRALLWVLPGVIVLVVGIVLLRPLRSLSRWIAISLLGGDDEADTRSPEAARAARRRALASHAAAFGAVNGLLVLIWAVTSRSYFWPEWTLITLGLPLAIHAWIVLVEERPDLVQRKRMTRSLTMHEGVAAALSLFFVLIWAVTGHGYFWPLWPIIGIGIVFAIHAALELARRGDRISVLESTRAGAVDQQEEELRRIERDLHDGAQARLVALGMSLGMAEQKLGSDPAAAQTLLADARRDAHEALAELRDLARGIHPPVLADRGLEAAIAALANRSPLRVNVAVDLPSRPSSAVETAAYFVVAESLANTGKHSDAQQVDVDVHCEADRLVVQVVDDGRGGADPSGGGLHGLARRVEALDGTLSVESPPGGPTAVRAVMPCGS
jgi:signal transduction histidine kinase